MNLQQTGLTDRDIRTIKALASIYPEIIEVKIFGSRALGNHKKQSDIDLCIYGEKIDFEIRSSLNGMFIGSNLGQKVDVVIYKDIENEDLRLHIDVFGIIVR